MGYQEAIAAAEAELIDRRSRFLAIAAPIGDEESARRLIAARAQAHPTANHVVYAYVLGPGHQIFAVTDAGEPHGTAGRPILEVLRTGTIINICVVVVRYFGGTKLGRGGLVRAYTGVAKEAVGRLALREYRIEREASIDLSYAHYEEVRRVLGDFDARIVAESYGARVQLVLAIPEESIEALGRRIGDITRGEVTL